MGWASRANKSPVPTKKKNSSDEFRHVKVHIPNSTMDIGDALFMGMLKGLRPMTPDERAEAKQQGLDLRPPDVRERERKFGLHKEKPEVQIILTDK